MTMREWLYGLWYAVLFFGFMLVEVLKANWGLLISLTVLASTPHALWTHHWPSLKIVGLVFLAAWVIITTLIMTDQDRMSGPI